MGRQGLTIAEHVLVVFHKIKRLSVNGSLEAFVILSLFMLYVVSDV